MFDKFTKYVNALSWPFQACKINAYGSAPCLRCAIQPVCEETLGEQPGEEDESIASIHPRQLFMNIKEQLRMEAGSHHFLLIISKHWNTLQLNGFIPSKVCVSLATIKFD